MSAFPPVDAVIFLYFCAGRLTIVVPVTYALTLGIVGRGFLPDQTASNEFYCKFGSAVYAGVVGLLALYVSDVWVFYVVGIMSMAAILLLSSIIPDAVDNELARGLVITQSRYTVLPSTFLSVLSDGRVIALLSIVFLYHFANAAMLPLLSQFLSLDDKGAGISMAAINIGVAQSVQAVTAIWLGFHLLDQNRQRLLLKGLMLLPVRGLVVCVLIKLIPSVKYALISTQILDGISHGIYNVVSVLLVEELAHGSGRFSFLLGALQTCHYAGDAFSHLVGEWIAGKLGYLTAFFFLTVLSLFPVILIVIFDISTPVRNDSVWSAALDSSSKSHRETGRETEWWEGPRSKSGDVMVPEIYLSNNAISNER